MENRLFFFVNKRTSIENEKKMIYQSCKNQLMMPINFDCGSDWSFSKLPIWFPACEMYEKKLDKFIYERYKQPNLVSAIQKIQKKKHLENVKKISITKQY